MVGRLIWIVLLGCFCGEAMGQVYLPHRRKAFRGVPASATYLIKQDFEGAGYDNSETWTESGSGTVNEDYTTSPAPLVGSESLSLSGTTVNPNTYASFSGGATIEAYFQWNRSSTTSKRVFSLRNSSGTAVATVVMETGGALTARCGSSGGTTTVSTTSTATTYHVWLRYVKGTGANGFASVGFSTDGVRPTSGNNYAEHTSGNATTDAARVMCGSDINTNAGDIYDKVRVDDMTIGDAPE